LLLLAGLLLAFSLRLHRLDAESLWYDETVSAYLASQTIPDLIAHTARDIHPPGYYLLLHFWQALTHPTPAHALEFLYAWPSLGFGMITLALIAAMAHQAGSLPAAATAVLLGALNPFQVMYSQEVRMYTLGSTMTLLTGWAAAAYLRTTANPAHSSRRPLGLVTLYVLAALAGLYTLYYFLFWLAILLPLITLALLRARRSGQSPNALRDWLIAQAAVAGGWLPWFPIFLRQALDPPVPPWRTAWSGWRDFAAAAAEALAAPAIGQSPPASTANWLWAALVLAVLIAYFVYTKDGAPANAAERWMLPALLLGPTALIFAVSLAITPLYHVRYLVPYAALFPVIAAVPIARLRAKPLLASGLLLLLTASAAAGLFAFWRAPSLRADDHRAAVATLARAWRPGDAILVNAGWVYPALAVYWPKTLSGPQDAIPPPIAAMSRLSSFIELRDEAAIPASTTLAPIVIRTGSVDASPNLGWGRDDSDFYAISAADTVAALDAVTAASARIWHYRLYDTVNDPTGVIRDALAQYGAPFFSATLPGPGYLLLEGYSARGPVPPAGTTVTESIDFGASVRLNSAQAPAAVAAGGNLYVVTAWAGSSTDSGEPLASSLRLYAQDGSLIAQEDTPLPDPTAPFTQSLALPIPAATAPGPYSLDLLVYRQADLTPLPAAPAASGTPALRLRTVEVHPP
jgi:hypothetical protein